MTSRPWSRRRSRLSSIPWSTSGGWPSQSSTSPTTRSGVPGAVRLRDVAGEPLVGDVGVVLERAEGLDHVDVAALVAPGERRGQLRAPHRRLHQTPRSRCCWRPGPPGSSRPDRGRARRRPRARTSCRGRTGLSRGRSDRRSPAPTRRRRLPHPWRSPDRVPQVRMIRPMTPMTSAATTTMPMIERPRRAAAAPVHAEVDDVLTAALLAVGVVGRRAHLRQVVLGLAGLRRLLVIGHGRRR